jgi:hypothetical protein
MQNSVVLVSSIPVLKPPQKMTPNTMKVRATPMVAPNKVFLEKNPGFFG